MPVFVFLVICGAVALWFLLAWLFKPLGQFLWKLWDDAYKEMTEDEENNKKENKK